MISIQEHLRQLLQTVSPSKILEIPLRLDTIYGYLNKVQINQVQGASQKVTLQCPNSITEVMDGLFIYNENGA